MFDLWFSGLLDLITEICSIIIPNCHYFSLLAYYIAFIFVNTDVFNHMINFLT